MTRFSTGLDVQLHRHEAAWLIAERSGSMSSASLLFRTSLIFSKREFPRPLFDAGTVHALDEPTP